MPRRAAPLFFALVSCADPPAPNISQAPPVRVDATPLQENPMVSSPAWITQPLDTIGALEAALSVRLPDPPAPGDRMGSLELAPRSEGGTLAPGDLQRVQMRYAWDLHHQAPVASAAALRSRPLTQFALHFTRGRSDFEAALRAAYGEPEARVKTGSGAPADYRQYGPFFIDLREGEAVVIEWYDRRPDWAAAAIDPAARSRALAELARALTAAASPEVLTAQALALPRSTGLVASDAASPGELTIDIAPPMPAIELASALGMDHAVAQSVGVHLAMWRVVVPSAPGGWSSFASGGWTVEPTLAGAASGDLVAGAPAGPIARRMLGPNDTVRLLRLVRARDGWDAPQLARLKSLLAEDRVGPGMVRAEPEPPAAEVGALLGVGFHTDEPRVRGAVYVFASAAARHEGMRRLEGSPLGEADTYRRTAINGPMLMYVVSRGGREAQYRLDRFLSAFAGDE